MKINLSSTWSNLRMLEDVFSTPPRPRRKCQSGTRRNPACEIIIASILGDIEIMSDETLAFPLQDLDHRRPFQQLISGGCTETRTPDPLIKSHEFSITLLATSGHNPHIYRGVWCISYAENHLITM